MRKKGATLTVASKKTKNKKLFQKVGAVSLSLVCY
jgi:hypothetical protein